MRLNDHKQTSAGILATMLPWLLISIAALTIGTVIVVQLYSAIDNVVKTLVH
jgi:hypothetical protein